MAVQLGALQDYMEGGARVALDEQDAASGFALARVIEPFLESPTDRNAAALIAYLTPNPQEVATATSILRAHAASHPLWASAASQQISQANAWNVSLQPTYASLVAGPSAPPMGSYPVSPAWANAAAGPMVYAASLQRGYPVPGAYATSPYAAPGPYTVASPYAVPNVYTVAGPYAVQSASTPLANTQLVGTLRDAVGTGVTVGGFDASMHEARFDRGDWPALTYYGLLYPPTADRALQ
jgi:hypothetical protein